MKEEDKLLVLSIINKGDIFLKKITYFFIKKLIILFKKINNFLFI